MSITSMAYDNRWNSTDQVFTRVISTGLLSRSGHAQSNRRQKYDALQPLEGRGQETANYWSNILGDKARELGIRTFSLANDHVAKGSIALLTNLETK